MGELRQQPVPCGSVVFFISFKQLISIRLPSSCYASLIRIKVCVANAVIKKFPFLLVLLIKV